jgi:hypothetical protein
MGSDGVLGTSGVARAMNLDLPTLRHDGIRGHEFLLGRVEAS